MKYSETFYGHFNISRSDAKYVLLTHLCLASHKWDIG